MEFLGLLLRHHLAGKPVVASPNVGCFFRLPIIIQHVELYALINFFCYLVVLCNAIKNNTSVITVNFTGCSLTWRGADTLAKVIRVI